MKKNSIKLSLAALLAISLAACGGGNGGDSKDRGGGVVELPDSFVSSLANIELKLVQNGTFAMGTDSTVTATYAGVVYSNPKHNVTISKPYYLGIYEVTQGQWLSVNSSNPSDNSNWQDDTIDTSNQPVNEASSLDALGFIQALNDAEPNIMINGEQYIYSLPSEAEFEYAARAGTTSERWFCEDSVSQADCNQTAQEYEWFNDSLSRQHDVGTKKPNPWGFYDMYGNVAESVLDTGNTFGNECKYLQEDITDPICNGNPNYTVTRSVSAGATFNLLYSSWRNYITTDIPAAGLGFRVALVAKSVRDNMTKYTNGTIIQ